MLPKISHPEFSCSLPSTGAKVKYRPWTVRDEKALLVSKEAKNDRDSMSAIKAIVGACVLNKDFNVDKIATFDVEFLFVKIRIVSVDSTSQVSYTDPEDGKTRPFTIDLEKVEVIKPPAPEKLIKIDDKIAIELAYLPASVWDDERVMTEAPDYAVVAAKAITKVYEGESVTSTSEVPEAELLEFVHDLPSQVGKKIGEFLDSTPRLDYSISWVNESGTERTMRLTNVNDFFSFA